MRSRLKSASIALANHSDNFTSKGPHTHRLTLRAAGPILLASIILLFPTGLSAQSLVDAMTAAFASNPGLDAERARQRADEETIRQEWAKSLPQVSLNASQGEQKSRLNGAAGATSLNQDSYSLTLSQPLFRGFQTLNGTRRAKSEVLAGAARLIDREQAVLLDTVTAYMDVLRDRKIIELRRSNVSFLKEELNATRARHRGGDLSKTDVAQARTRLFEGEADLAQAEADVEISEATFEAIVGRKPGSLTAPGIPGGLLPVSLEAAIRFAEASNPQIVSSVHQQEAARRAKREAYGTLLPTVSLDLSHGIENNSTTSIDKEEESSVFVRLKMPLYQGGDSYSRIRESRARESGAAYEVTDTRRRTRANVIDAWKQFHAAGARIHAAKQQVSSARDALRGVRIEVKVGERALFEVLDAQRELVNGEVALARAEHDHVVSSFTLLASIGQLTARSLRLPAAYPDGENYVRRKNPRVTYAKGRKNLRMVKPNRAANYGRPPAPETLPARSMPVHTIRQEPGRPTILAPSPRLPFGLRSSLPPN